MVSPLLSSIVRRVAMLVVLSAPLLAQANTVTLALAPTSSWMTGFQAAVTITNNATWTIVDWSLEFDMTPTITSIWDASVQSHVGTHYVLRAVQASWEDGDLSPGESKTFGFVASTSTPPVLPATATLNGAPVLTNGTSPAPPPMAPTLAPPWPPKVFAPYVDATAWPPFDLVGTMQTQGVRFYNLAFVVAASPTNGTPSWGGYYDVASGYLLAEVNQIRAQGGDVMVSFGGAAGTELAGAHSTATTLQASYQSVIDAYGLTHIDFDIEGSWLAHPASIQRRSQAIAGLQSAAAISGRPLSVWFTLPVLPTGLTADGLTVLQSALAHGVNIAGVNIMAMDYGASAAPNPSGMMGAYAIQAATSLFNQLATLFAANSIPKTAAQIWAMIGITPMIGQNDVAGEVFTPSDASQLIAFANQQHVGFLSFWSATRDGPCPGGPSPWASSTCSGIAQSPFAFTQLFVPYTNILWVDLGQSLAGASGSPAITARGPLMGNSTLTLNLTQAAASAPGWLIAGGSAVNWSIVGGIVVPSPDILLPIATSAQGSLALTATWPMGVPTGFPLHLQVAISDPTGPQSFALSNALLGIAP